MTQPAEAPQTESSVTAPDQQIAAHEADDRAAMIAIADQIRAENPDPEEDAAAEVAPERDATGKFLPKTPPPVGGTDKGGTQKAAVVVAADADEPQSKLAVAIRAREAAQKTRDTAKAEAESFFNDTKARAHKEAESIISDARRQAERELGEWRAKLRASPLQAIKEGGIDARTLVDEVTREGSPEWQAQKRLEASQAKIDAELAELRTWREQQTKDAEAFQQQERGRRQKETEAKFVALIPETSALRTLYDPSEIVARAHVAADMYRETTGDIASLEDLRDYMEEQAAKRLASITGSGAKAAAQGLAAKTKANGPRTPSSSSASERRTSPKPNADPSPEESRDAMKQAAEDAMSAYVKT